MWQRPITTRRYLHPPKCERVVTLWSEGKLVLGEVELAEGPTVPDYYKIISCGIWPVYGKNDEAADFKTAKSILFDRGIPVHSIENRFGTLNVTEEAFCDTARQCSVYVKFTVLNTSSTTEDFGLMVRTGYEAKLVFDAPDVYKSYAPDVNAWKETEATWHDEGSLLKDGDYFIKPLGDDYSFDSKKGIIRIAVPPKQEITFCFILGKGEIPSNDYDSQKQSTVSFYLNELARLYPLHKTMDQQLVDNLVIQLLQCFTAPKSTELIMCRQGGLQRRIWPFEAMYALEALDRLGDFDDYIEPVIDLYFHTMQVESGEIVPLGIYWAMSTAVSLYSFADHALRSGNDFYLKYRNEAMRAFEFIRNTRVADKSNPNIVTGLYPPLQSCDATDILQAWTITDPHNLVGLKKLALAAETFGDERAEEIKAEYSDYLCTLKQCYDRAKVMLMDDDKLILTNHLPFVPEGSRPHPFRAHAGIIASCLELSAEDIDLLLNGLKAENSLHEGLYNRMPDYYRMKDPDGKVRMWYTTLEEYFWFEALKRIGRLDKCQQIVESICRYSMTEEYQMVERYHPEDPWFVPWSPNASANGRLLLLLLQMAEF